MNGGPRHRNGGNPRTGSRVHSPNAAPRTGREKIVARWTVSRPGEARHSEEIFPSTSQSQIRANMRFLLHAVEEPDRSSCVHCEFLLQKG